MLTVEVKDQTLTIPFATYRLRVQIMTEAIVRVTQVYAMPLRPSYAIEGDKQVPTPFTWQQEATGIKIQTARLIIKIDEAGHLDVQDETQHPLVQDYRGQRVPLDRRLSAQQQALAQQEGHHLEQQAQQHVHWVMKTLNPEDVFYGLGDKPGFMNKRDYYYENWNTDNPAPQLENFPALYKSIPILYGLTNGHPFGLFFDSPERNFFDLGKESPAYYLYGVVSGNVDYYVLGGTDLAEVVQNYTYLTGRTPLPQKWTLGYQQSRWGYYDEAEFTALVAKFRALNLPLDAVHMDIDYMEQYKVFTWDQTKYPNRQHFAEKMRQQGIKLVTILDPGVKQEPGYSLYDEGQAHHFFATEHGETYVNEVWPGAAVYPDFGQRAVRSWWGEHLRFLTDLGVAGIWNDMNEPASFKGPLPDSVVMVDHDQPSTHQHVHNVYGHNMARATAPALAQLQQARPFVITRAAYAGTQKYATVWTGDNHSLWAHLQMMIPQLCNLGLSGFAFSGTDIGGFGSDTTPELLIRWVEAALFSPLFRNHSSMGTRAQEPWAFDDETLAIYRVYLRLRYRFIPYLYNLLEAGQRTGLPVMRPLVVQYPDDPQVYELNDEFLVGSELVVAPVVEKGQTERRVYLPSGQWFDFWTGKVYVGQQSYLIKAALDYLPLFVRNHALIPWGYLENYVGEKPERHMNFYAFGTTAGGEHYQDNGTDFAYQQGEYNRYQIEVTPDGGTITLTHHGMTPYQTITLHYQHQQWQYAYHEQRQRYELILE